MESMMRILALAFLLATISVFVIISNFFGGMSARPGSAGGANESVASDTFVIPASTTTPISVNDGASDNTYVPPPPPGPNETALVEGVYARVTRGETEECSLSAYDSVGLRKKSDNISYIIIGNDDIFFDATYNLAYDSSANTCSFSLNEGATKYYYTCEIWIDTDKNKPKIKVVNIRTVITNEFGSESETYCDDGEEFILK